MIPLRDVMGWRAHAPWVDDTMVEQDYLISRAVELLFTHPKLRQQLAMRGGTVLHKGHLAPAARYSEDIDLVLVEAKRSRRGIWLDIADALEPLLGRPTESVVSNVRLFVRNLAAKSKIARLEYVYAPTDTSQAQAKLKVEINLNENRPLYPLTPVTMVVPTEQAGGTRTVDVVSYDIDEMLGTKLRALFQREHGRDLFDLWHAWRMSDTGRTAHPIDPQRVGQAFRHYLLVEGSTAFTAADAEAELAIRLRSRKFCNDMAGWLAEGVDYQPAQAGEDFRRVYMPHL